MHPNLLFGALVCFEVTYIAELLHRVTCLYIYMHHFKIIYGLKVKGVDESMCAYWLRTRANMGDGLPNMLFVKKKA
jgi:hypothetical protein